MPGGTVLCPGMDVAPKAGGARPGEGSLQWSLNGKGGEHRVGCAGLVSILLPGQGVPGACKKLCFLVSLGGGISPQWAVSAASFQGSSLGLTPKLSRPSTPAEAPLRLLS